MLSRLWCLSGIEILVKQFISKLVGRIEPPLQRDKLSGTRIGTTKLLRRSVKLIGQIVGTVEIQRGND